MCVMQWTLISRKQWRNEIDWRGKKALGKNMEEGLIRRLILSTLCLTSMREGELTSPNTVRN
jgi:hypothetical protein